MKVEECSDFEVLMARYVVLRISNIILTNLTILTVMLAFIGLMWTVFIIYTILVIVSLNEPGWDSLTDILNSPKENQDHIENWSERRILYEIFAELRGLKLSEEFRKKLSSV